MHCSSASTWYLVWIISETQYALFLILSVNYFWYTECTNLMYCSWKAVWIVPKTQCELFLKHSVYVYTSKFFRKRSLHYSSNAVCIIPDTACMYALFLTLKMHYFLNLVCIIPDTQHMYVFFLKCSMQNSWNSVWIVSDTQYTCILVLKRRLHYSWDSSNAVCIILDTMYALFQNLTCYPQYLICTIIYQALHLVLTWC